MTKTLTNKSFIDIKNNIINSLAVYNIISSIFLF